MNELPRYDDLPITPGAPSESAWGVFGVDDEVGTLNLIEPEAIARAAQLVRRGVVFSLNWDVDLPSPAFFIRKTPKHVIVKDAGDTSQDDYYQDFWPQASSQLDGLAHIAHPEHGFYNGHPRETVTGFGGDRLGIEQWSRRGIAGRFVLLDVGRYRESVGRPIDQATREWITAEDLEATRLRQGVHLQRGDILMIRMGWIAWYRSLDTEARTELVVDPDLAYPGLAPGPDCARWLWDNGVAAVGMDNVGLDAYPFDRTMDGFLHFRLIPLLGMCLGELWDLEALATDCAETETYVGLFTSAPIQKTGGVGSPANALALK